MQGHKMIYAKTSESKLLFDVKSVQTTTDWAKKPEPWRSIGPMFRAECELIMKLPLKELSKLNKKSY
jgi:hypothetical protein